MSLTERLSYVGEDLGKLLLWVEKEKVMDWFSPVDLYSPIQASNPKLNSAAPSNGPFSSSVPQVAMTALTLFLLQRYEKILKIQRLLKKNGTNSNRRTEEVASADHAGQRYDRLGVHAYQTQGKPTLDNRWDTLVYEEGVRDDLVGDQLGSPRFAVCTEPNGSLTSKKRKELNVAPSNGPVSEFRSTGGNDSINSISAAKIRKDFENPKIIEKKWHQQ